MYGRILKDEKGSAFLMAIMGLAIISVITITAVFMGSSNAKQTHTEGKRTQAYYVAETGAKTMVEELKGLPADKLKAKLIEMKGKGIIEGSYTDDTTAATPVKYKFEIEVVETDKENVYELRSTGYSNDGTKDGTRVIIPLEDKGSSGYKKGDGKIFITGTEKTVIPYLPQLSESGVSIYTKGALKSDLEKRPVMFTQDAFGELFKSRNDRKKGTDKQLSDEYKMATTKDGKQLGNYHLKIRETDGNYIKRELIERKESERPKDKDGNYIDKTIELNYDMQKEEILNYFSYKKLPSNSLLGSDLEEAISNTFMLPIHDKDSYSKYLSGDVLFPLEAYSNPTVYNHKEGAIELTGEKQKKELDLRGKDSILIDGRIVVDNGSELTIKVSNGANIYVNGEITTNDADSKGMNKVFIEIDEPKGKANFHIKGGVNFDGLLRVGKFENGKVENKNENEVTFYVHGSQFQINNSAEIKDVHLYAPNTIVSLGNDIIYEGVIIAKEVKFNDKATFRAPSAGTDSSDMNKKWELGKLEWKEWQSNK